jgi:hypothetical protein
MGSGLSVFYCIGHFEVIKMDSFGCIVVDRFYSALGKLHQASCRCCAISCCGIEIGFFPKDLFPGRLSSFTLFQTMNNFARLQSMGHSTFKHLPPKRCINALTLPVFRINLPL